MLNVGGATFPELSSEVFRVMAEEKKLFSLGRTSNYDGANSAPSMTIFLGLPSQALPEKAFPIDPYRAWALFSEPVENNMTQFEFH
jgi:hypothetical protein